MIKADDVKKVASLSRIHLKEDEIKELTENLEDILKYINKLENLDVTNVAPTSHVLQLENVYREDKVRESLTQENALKIAIEKHKGSFKVPKVIE